MAQGLLEDSLLLPRSHCGCHVFNELVLIRDRIIWCHPSWILLLSTIPMASDLHSSSLCRRCHCFQKGNFAIPNENKPDSTPYTSSTLGITPIGAFLGSWIITIWNHFRRVVLCHDFNMAGLLLLHLWVPLLGLFLDHHYYN